MAKILWTTKKIKEGFDLFISENDRLPTSSEIDTLGYLPSARLIQKRFGGLQALREQFGYTDTHFGKGAYRGVIAHTAGLRSKQLEIDLHTELQSQFSESCIQREKAFFGRRRVDFYIKTPSGNLGIDIFYAETMRTLQSSVNIKMKRYKEFTEPLYLTVANESICQKDLNGYIHNKKLSLPENIHLVSLKTLRKDLKKYRDTKYK